MARKKGLSSGRKGLFRSPKRNMDGKEEVDKLKSLVGAYETEIEDLKAQNVELKLFKTKYEDLVKQRLNQFEEIEALKSKYGTLRGKGDDLKAQNEDLKKKIAFLNAQLEGERARPENLPVDEPNFRHFFYNLSKYEILISKVLTF